MIMIMLVLLIVYQPVLEAVVVEREAKLFYLVDGPCAVVLPSIVKDVFM